MSQASYPSLAQRHVLVTGGGTGIGAAIVEGFARADSRVTFFDIAGAESRELADRVTAAGGVAEYLYCDLLDPAAIERSIAAAIERQGPVEVLVNNAANDDRHRIEDVTSAYWDERIAVNLRHYYLSAKAVLPGMKAARRGAILNLGSVSWHLGLPDLSIYETAKAGIEGMTRGLARDVGEFGIRVNCVVPGAVRTPRQTRLWHTPEAEADILKHQCLKERVDPEHVAAMCLFLASEDARMCTAHSYFVDAGWR